MRNKFFIVYGSVTPHSLSIFCVLILLAGLIQPVAGQSSPDAGSKIPYQMGDNLADSPKGDITGSLLHGKVERRYLLHVPPVYIPSKSYPLVVVLHGMWGTSESIAKETGFSLKADAEGFLVVYPQALGIPYMWNTGINADTENLSDDVGFIRSVIAEVRRGYSINPNRIYITGHSSGAIMTYRLGSELADVVAAIAPVEGTLGIYTPIGTKELVSKSSIPVAVAAIHGRYDGMEAFDQNGPQTIFLPVMDGVEFWVKNNACATRPLVSLSVSGGFSVSTYSGCRNSAEVALYMIDQADHFWPTVENCGVSATDLAWDFFNRHPMKRPASGSSALKSTPTPAKTP